LHINGGAHQRRRTSTTAHINDGGAATREDAERECMEVIDFALEGDPAEYDSAAQAITLGISVTPAA
jgi:hypothetical protein